MDIRQINDEYSVTGQITPADLDDIKALGFKSIVCNRPDEEEPGQPSFDEVAARARDSASISPMCRLAAWASMARR
jgi:uncharacterized protein (TIGR01244 family)